MLDPNDPTLSHSPDCCCGDCDVAADPIIQTRVFYKDCPCKFNREEVIENGFTQTDSTGVPACVKCGKDWRCEYK